MPRLCMIFEATGPYNAIGKVAMAQVETALDAGWQVSVVAKRLSESLQGRVEWLKLYVPPRGFALQWLSARHYIKAALGDSDRFDVIHGHQPQIADLCDVFQCHFLSRAAYETKCLVDADGWRGGIEAIQKRVALNAEDRLYGNWNPRTHMLFDSSLTREWFARYYRMPISEEVLLYPSPQWKPVDAVEQVKARFAIGINTEGPVLGFLGGKNKRKGYDRVVAALCGHPDITLLMGGSNSEDFDAPDLSGHFKNVGLVSNTQQFYAACDALIVASRFEPFGYVASEAAARGVPVIATENVGALTHILEYNAGAAWKSDEQLAPIVRYIIQQKSKFVEGCKAYTAFFSRDIQDQYLLKIWQSHERRRTNSFHPRVVSREMLQFNMYSGNGNSLASRSTSLNNEDAPTFCVLFESVSEASAIARAAKLNVEIMLRAGWKVTVVSKYLAPELVGKVEWIHLYVPPFAFAVKWLTARWFFRRAIKNRTFDVVHAHQPQVADLADVFQCHFLTRVAYERNCLRSGIGIRAAIGELQTRIAMPVEDYFFRHWNPKTRILFNSALTRTEFGRLYSMPPLEQILVRGTSFKSSFPSPEDRASARKKYVGDEAGLVVGYLGGIQERKGYKRILNGVRGAEDLILLMGGSHGKGFVPPIENGLVKFVGLVEKNTTEFYAACDVFVVPSIFEPMGMVAFEAAACGIPVICTREVGALTYLLEFGSGEVWDPSEPIAPLVRKMVKNRHQYLPGIKAMGEHLSEERYASQLLDVCSQVLAAKRCNSLQPKEKRSVARLSEPVVI